jgi:O-antigen/teichoic acid export membrane protein
MKKYISLAKKLAFTSTAKDTYILFVGNVGSAFWGFLFILIVARALSIEDFGIFSAAVNLATILISIVDVGISSGAINFVSAAINRKDEKTANEYIKASLVVRMLLVAAFSVILVLLSPFIAKTLLATNNAQVATLTALLCIFIFPNGVFPYLFQAKREFLFSVIVDNANFIFRLGAAYILILLGMFRLPQAFWSYFAGFLVTIILSFWFLGVGFLKTKPKKGIYHSLLRFSGWIGVNRVISGISGRLDVAMLAALSGAITTGLYSIPQRLVMFIPVLASSYSAVLAPRMAGFSDKVIQKKYFVKSIIGIVPMILGAVFIIFIARPFIVLLFGEKYIPAAPILRLLVTSYIPFIVSIPSVTAIIYAMKKTVYIGSFSFFQLAAVFALNLVFIPKYGSIGPTITIGIVNTILAVYSWIIVIRYFWFGKN